MINLSLSDRRKALDTAALLASAAARLRQQKQQAQPIVIVQAPTVKQPRPINRGLVDEVTVYEINKYMARWVPIPAPSLTPIERLYLWLTGRK